MKKQAIWIAGAFFGGFILLSMTTFTSNDQEKWDVPAKYQKMVNPYADAADDENIGRIVYAKHCKSCHGSKGKGDGTKAKSIDTPMGDFTDDSFKNQTDGALYYKTYFGRDDMPSFDKKITAEEDKWLVINYIKNL
ncbi:c-type cytochrome [uncultured Eudoraea sp.]|jgi:mono/diheme cytochrome c family protein|uniref:c-type cytochrome n=1 Tax=uncultured Eudoraea sp. TaxID=1035614 RepID=UPI00260E8925|nr:c-type cytochrome [uncultured Eudoraea sp.]